ncbi:MAG TPA: helix-turn-helix transcriptional regulator, partial [Thermomicrobiaceae bacterium]|nr:helix-turn-helix transcriptional regulator [Thermomicrobiaceae bacterium]
EEDEIQMRMLDYFLALAEVADAAVTRTGWDIAALETDLDNLRTALNWALRLQPEAALQFAGALGFLWYFQGYYQEGIRWLEAVLAVTPKSPVLEARARSRLAAVLMEVGNRTQARRAAELSLTLYQAIGDRAGEALQLNAAGLIDAMESALNRAAEEFEISLRLFQEAGHAAGVALVLANLGWVSVLRRDRRRAAATLEESLALARTGGDRGYLGWALVNQGRLDLEMGRLDRARDSFIEALELDAVAVAQLSVPPRIVVSALQGLAAVAATEHDAIGAAQVLGTAEAICDATGFVAWPAEQAFHQRYLAAARAQLSDAEWSTALETGRALGIRETLADAQARHNSPPKSPKYGLSARELEVLRLVAEGLTDAAVGSRLFISPRTVSQHLRSIYNKLGVHSRLAATRLAVEQHLV